MSFLLEPNHRRFLFKYEKHLSLPLSLSLLACGAGLRRIPRAFCRPFEPTAVTVSASKFSARCRPVFCVNHYLLPPTAHLFPRTSSLSQQTHLISRPFLLTSLPISRIWLTVPSLLLHQTDCAAYLLALYGPGCVFRNPSPASCRKAATPIRRHCPQSDGSRRKHVHR